MNRNAAPNINQRHDMESTGNIISWSCPLISCRTWQWAIILCMWSVDCGQTIRKHINPITCKQVVTTYLFWEVGNSTVFSGFYKCATNGKDWSVQKVETAIFPNKNSRKLDRNIHPKGDPDITKRSFFSPSNFDLIRQLRCTLVLHILWNFERPAQWVPLSFAVEQHHLASL